MAVPEQIPVVNYVADGIVKKFDVPFEYDQQSDLHVYVDGVESTIDKYYFDGNAFNFYIAPTSGQSVKIKRITPKERDTDYNLHTNTVRPKALNTDFDRLWYVLQEVFSDVGGLSQAVQDEIIARIQGDEDLLNQLTAEISARMLGDEAVTEDLKNYVDQVIGAIINDPDFDGIDADKVNDASGETQQQVNYNGGSKWHVRVGGYKLNESAVLTNGNIVKSTIPNNINDPNADMTGWMYPEKIHAKSIAELQSSSLPVGSEVYLELGNRSGKFVIKSSGDLFVKDKTFPDQTITLAQAATNDTFNAVFIQTQSGVAVREYTDFVDAAWYGVEYDWDTVAQTGTDYTLQLKAAMYFAQCQRIELQTGAGYVRTTSALITQQDNYWKVLTWVSSGTYIVADHAGNGIVASGGASTFKQRGTLNFIKSNAYATSGGNAFPDLSSLANLQASSNIGFLCNGNRHDIEDLWCFGFNVGAVFYAGSNANYSNHKINVRDNDVGALAFGPSDDLSVIDSEIHAYGNYQEAFYVKPETYFRQWECRTTAENNLLDVLTNPSLAGRYAVYIGHHIGCNIWVYAEQYSNLTGTLEFYASDTGSSEIFSARRNSDYIRGNNTGINGSTRYQNFWMGNPVERKATPLRLQGLGLRADNINDYVDLPFLTSSAKYGSLRGQQNKLFLLSENEQHKLGSSNGGAFVGADFNNTVAGEYLLTTAEASKVINLKTLLANEPCIGSFTLIAGAYRASVGYNPVLLKFDFHVAGGVLTIKSETQTSINPRPADVSASLSFESNSLKLTVSYNPVWFGESYRFRYALEILRGFGL